VEGIPKQSLGTRKKLWQIRLIFVFLFSENYKENLQFYAQRMSNNSFRLILTTFENKRVT
jgi:hypothetical protein